MKLSKERLLTGGFGLLVLPLLLLSVGCSDCECPETESDETSDEVECPATNDPIDPSAIIHDMEDGSDSLPLIAGRSGGWWTAGDMTPGASIEPASGVPALPEPIPNGRCGSEYAMRVSGQGFDDWGAMLGLSFAYGAGGQIAYDASRWEGITFWARIGDTSTTRVRFALGDENSEPEGGVCEVDGDAELGCYNTYGTALPGLDETWREYRIPFDGLEQRDFGLQREQLATDALFTVHFAFEPGAVFDLWVDDLRFY